MYPINISYAQGIGQVRIIGDMKYGETLSITRIDGDDGLNLSYNWRRNGIEIEGETQSTYTIKEKDIGIVLNVLVYDTEKSLQAISHNNLKVDKAQKEAPINIEATGCTNIENNDGTIINVSKLMEYRKFEDNTYLDVTGDTINNLSSGIYKIRYKETGTHYSSLETEITVDEYIEYTISFDSNGGEGSKDEIKVEANSKYVLEENTFIPPKDKKFSKWLVKGEEKDVGDEIVILENTIIKAIWVDNIKEKPIEEPIKPIGDEDPKGPIEDSEEKSEKSIEDETIEKPIEEKKLSNAEIIGIAAGSAVSVSLLGSAVAVYLAKKQGKLQKKIIKKVIKKSLKKAYNKSKENKISK